MVAIVAIFTVFGKFSFFRGFLHNSCISCDCGHCLHFAQKQHAESVQYVEKWGLPIDILKSFFIIGIADEAVSPSSLHTTKETTK